MHELTGQELYEAIAYARSLDETQGKQILVQFAQEQPGFYQTLFEFLPAMIGEYHQEMAHLFMDLCFDVLCVFQQAFGKPVHNSDDPVWRQKQAALLQADLQALAQHPQDDKVRQDLQARLTQSSPYTVSQAALLGVLNEGIDDYATLDTNRVPAAEITKAMMGITVKLFCSLYDNPTQH